MHWNRAFRLQSFAHYFCTLTLVVMGPYQAFAEESAANKQRLDTGFYAKPDQCARAQSEADAAKRDLNRACENSGSGASCLSQIKKCAAIGESEEYGPDVLE